MKRRRISACGTVLPLAAAMFSGCVLGSRIQMDTHYLFTGALLTAMYTIYFVRSKQNRHPGTYLLCLACFLIFGMELRGSRTEPAEQHFAGIRTTAVTLNQALCNRIDTLTCRYSIDSVMARQTSATLKALLMGNKKEISRETAGNFRLSGTVHLLALSGLHIGIIYLFVSYLFLGIPAYGFWRILKGVLIILAIWSFTLVTGLGISTVRASIFVTIREISRMLYRMPSAGDILGTTALLMLSADPGFALDLGFQMSFAAVAGIVLMVNPISRLYKETSAELQHRIQMMEGHGKNFKRSITMLIRIGYSVISNATVTSICQLTSGTIALYHFRVYPRFFLLANLLAIPAATISVFTGMTLLVLGWIPPIGKTACVILNISIYALEKIASLFA